MYSRPAEFQPYSQRRNLYRVSQHPLHERLAYLVIALQKICEPFRQKILLGGEILLNPECKQFVKEVAHVVTIVYRRAWLTPYVAEPRAAS
jgi:hypothetical protein